VYEKKPLKDPKGNVIPGLFNVWIRLNNPGQYNSYTTEMVKGVIAGFENASTDRSIVAVVFTGTGPYSFCTGGNTKEYSEYYSMRPEEYGSYMELFNNMVDSILMCKKPVICRVNGMRVAGGQEIGTACDLSIASDLAILGQAGPRHGSAPVGGASDFLPFTFPSRMPCGAASAVRCGLPIRCGARVSSQSAFPFSKMKKDNGFETLRSLPIPM
jgi:6-oxo-cyclohex-1-ene-carbonyl-CoA hydrolase